MSNVRGVPGVELRLAGIRTPILREGHSERNRACMEAMQRKSAATLEAVAGRDWVWRQGAWEATGSIAAPCTD